MDALKTNIHTRHILMHKPKVRPVRSFRAPAALWRKLGRMMIFIVILYLLMPCPTAAQPLTIITDPYPPLGYVHKDGEIVGFTVDVIKLLLKRTGIEGKFEMYPWARAYEMAQKEKDILIYQLTYTKERDRLFQLVGPVLSVRYYFFKLKERKDVVVKNLADAKKFLVGTVRDYFAHRYLLENGFEEGKNLEVTHDDNINLKKLADRRIDLMILIEIVFSYRARELGYNRDDFEKTFLIHSEDAYIGFSRQTSKITVSRIAKALEAAKKDGSYYRILERYGVSRPVEGKKPK
jgi:polar amino acid transport system substrate-binding protein